MEVEREASLGLALSALQKQVSRLPVPYTLQQEIDDPHGLCRCCTILAAFIEPFVEELKRKESNGAITAADHDLKTELLKLYVSQKNLDFSIYLRSPYLVGLENLNIHLKLNN